jgi:hypothetical protein
MSDERDRLTAIENAVTAFKLAMKPHLCALQDAVNMNGDKPFDQEEIDRFLDECIGEAIYFATAKLRDDIAAQDDIERLAELDDARRDYYNNLGVMLGMPPRKESQ